MASDSGRAPDGLEVDKDQAAPAAHPPGMFGTLFKRAFSADLAPGVMLPDEESAIEVVHVHGGSEPLKRVLLWRRGAILVALVFLIPSTFLHLVRDFINLGAAGPYAGIAGLALAGTLAGVGLCFGAFFAFKRWDDWGRSRRILFWTWLIAFLAPFVLALVPYAAFGGRELGVAGGIVLLFTLAPKALSLVPGVLRAAMTTKALFPGSPAPGWLLLMGAPFYMLLLLVVMLTPYQFAGGGLMALAVFCFLGAPIFLIRAGRKLASAGDPEATLEIIRNTRMATTAFNGAGGLFVFISLINLVSQLNMNPLEAFAPLLAIVANVFVLGVVGVDSLLVVLTRSHVPEESPEVARAREGHQREMSAFIAAQTEAQPTFASARPKHIDYDQPTEPGTRAPPPPSA